MLQQVRAPTIALPQTTTTAHSDGDSSLPSPYKQNQFEFPSMATQQQRPQLQNQNQSHSRSSSFFSFRNKHSLANQQQRTPSMANEGDSSAASLPYSLPPLNSSPGRAPDSQPQYAPQQSMTRATSTQSPLARAPSVQGNGQAQSSPPPQPQPPSQAQAQPPPGPPPLHPEIRSVVNLNVAHAHKIYFSGPLIRRIERQPDGQRPHKDEGWTDVWAQLGGTTLSIWDMRQIQEASKQGREVPPAYVNTTDAFVQVLGSVTTPASAGNPPKKYANVLTLNTAGSNLLLFSCPTTAALMSWAAALRLSAWEKSRLEEIYTAHLIRITLNTPDSPSTLVHGQMEGWVRIRIAGQTDWKRMWMVVAAGAEGGSAERAGQSGLGIGSVPPPPAAGAAVPKKRRMSALFSRDHSSQHASGPLIPLISMYSSSKPKDKKKALLTMKNVTQAFAVYPERPELISRSTLIKVEGTFGDEEAAGVMKSREAWVLIMPELEGGLGQAAEMLKWVVALHDAFEMYGRPERWTWDPRDPISLMFAYPVGPTKELLFLDRELAETLDPREERTSAIRSRLIGILLDRMRGYAPPSQPPRLAASDTAPSLPPIGGVSNDNLQQVGTSPPASSLPQLPPLSFTGTAPSQAPPPEKKQLTPITERSSGHTNGRATSADVLTPSHNGHLGQDQAPASLPPSQDAPLFNRALAGSPQPATPPSTASEFEPPARSPPTQSPVLSPGLGRRGFDSPSTNKGFQVQSRYSSNASSVATSDRTFGDGASTVTDPANVELPLSPTSETRTMFSSPSPPTAPAPVPAPSPPVPYAASAPAPPSPPSPRSPAVPFKNSRSPPPSVLTSPHSDAGHGEPDRLDSDRASAKTSILTSSHLPLTRIENRGPFASPGTASPTLQGQAAAPPPPPPPSKAEENHNFYNDAGAALYYMQQSEQDGTNFNQHRRVPTTIAEQDGDESSSSSSQYGPPQSKAPSGTTSPQSGHASVHSRSPPVRQSTPMAFIERTSSSTKSATSLPPGDRLSPSRQALGRKPSGARAQATRSYNGDGISSSQQFTEDEEIQTEDQDYDNPPNRMEQPPRPSASSDDQHLDVLAALSYLDTEDKPSSPKQVRVEPLNLRSTNKSPPPAPAAQEHATQFKSSFAPSKQAAERKAKAQAQQAAHHAAVHKPGRANGKRKSRVAGAWNESSDEEEEEEDEEDDQADSDTEPLQANKAGSGFGSSNTSLRQSQAQAEQDMSQQYSHLRPPRTLPQIPGNQNYPEEYNPPPRRLASDQFSERRTLYDGTQIRTQAEVPQPGAARQSVWSQVLDPGRNVNIETPRGTFVQLDQAETMTKAFTPQGLLSAGMQDKQDRSAKRQEELARETGASLINVPNKPPPPQMGLLGAITAHERERKREGGVGAALTEREREKRMAEDRQRRFDDQQRQQLEQMQQGGSMYGGQMPGYGMMGNPMMMMNPMMGIPPMMTGGGMSPMMTGGGMAPMMTGQMGYPGMMPAYNPQHLFAAQQAAQAYQQAMMAFSVAGSQVGGDGATQQQPLNPAMTGGGMGGYDPRMSMMGMPMMGAPQMAPMGMQMTGMSGFDPRFPPNVNNSPGSMNDPGLAPPAGFGGQTQTPSRNSSPASRGSPLARPADASRGSSRPASPKP
ncbi:hypothetical protein Hypma_006695 [Hypsizygus marmoreus]|uniref:Skg3/CAF120-like PH-like domain-containing protein n=1 Tax=Hypsizygus marmoreus TaxID=39966 RepID=A0A369JXB9_HYPMA|nr:hypothetical protein Hypma_006695 [Hypsizygus marmoreus]